MLSSVFTLRKMEYYINMITVVVIIVKPFVCLYNRRSILASHSSAFIWSRPIITHLFDTRNAFMLLCV